MINHQHEKWMRLALELAGRGRNNTSPNPMVGACVVRGQTLVGSGYHKQYGGSHAEIMALHDAGKKASGAALYVTLEPCASWGKTPPCVSAIIHAGIRRVIVGTLDPNPLNHGKGVQALRKEGVEVKTGILAKEVKEENQAFFKFVTRRLPFVTLKMAQSLDGKIATFTGQSRWISSKAAREFVHKLRNEQDAVLVGKNTLFLDNPKLNPGLNHDRKILLSRKIPERSNKTIPAKPWRIAIDPMLQVSRNARIFKGDQLTLIAIAEQKMNQIVTSRPDLSSVLLPVRAKKGRLDVTDLLKKLAGLGVAKLLVEGGGELAWSLLHAGLVDKAYWIIAPKIVGGKSAKTSVEGEGFARLSQSAPCRDVKVSRLGEDWLFECRFGKPGSR